MQRPALRSPRPAWAGAVVRHLHHRPATVGGGVVVALLGALVFISGHATTASGVTTAPLTPVPTASARGPLADTTTRATSGPVVAPLRHRTTPDLLITSRRPLTIRQVQTVEGTVGKGAVMTVAYGQVYLGHGTTRALGVDPSRFRNFAPQGTAESNPLWQTVARGEVAVAHAVAKALHVPLGGQTTVGRRAAGVQLRVGAYATMGIPGIGVVVDRSLDRSLGLVPGAGLIATTPGHDPVLVAGELRQALGSSVTVSVLRVPTSGGGRLTWVPPCVGPITSPFGLRPNPNGGPPGFHEGIDIGANYGAPIYAASDGVVLYAGPASGFGNEVVLQHAGGVITVYGHMEQILVTSGPVRAGQPIALVGSEGDSTGPHLHFEVHINDTPVDPLQWLESHGVRVIR